MNTYMPMNKELFFKEVNRLRLDNKNKWYWFSGTVEGIEIQIKAYNTYLQIFKANGVSFGGLCDLNVGDFKRELARPFTYFSNREKYKPIVNPFN